MDLTKKTTQVKMILERLESVVVAFSGGVDSTLLLKLASDTLGENALGVTAISASLPSGEKAYIEKLVDHIGVKQQFLISHEMDNPQYRANTPDRCFYCKDDLFKQLTQFSSTLGYKSIVDGANADDALDHRPGSKAARQYDVRSPLQEAGLTKAEIREIAKTIGLPNWDKPSAACLASRIPYGTPISLDVLSQVDQAEQILRKLGFRELRVRHHGNVARIEVSPSNFEAILQQRDVIVNNFKKIGYTYITLDLAGFRSGSLNEVLPTSGHE